MTTPLPKVPLFMSHIHEDEAINAALAALIHDACADRFDIFNTTLYPIKSGARWRDEIKNALDRAQVVLVILTPQSVKREWVLFEAGAAWLAAENAAEPKTRLIPCRFGLDQYPTSLGEYQGVDLTSYGETQRLITELCAMVGMTQPAKTIKQHLDTYFASLEAISPALPPETDPNIATLPVDSLLEIIERLAGERTARDVAEILARRDFISEDARTAYLKKLLTR